LRFNLLFSSFDVNLIAEIRKRERTFIYSDACMKLLEMLRQISKLTLRRLRELVDFFFKLMGGDPKTPEFRRLSLWLLESRKYLKSRKPNEMVAKNLAKSSNRLINPSDCISS
tara:strand:+ start:1067 stop:1405 length:339 start_codon:yes stop_codon:yes gene_type:complete